VYHGKKQQINAKSLSVAHDSLLVICGFCAFTVRLYAPEDHPSENGAFFLVGEARHSDKLRGGVVAWMFRG